MYIHPSCESFVLSDFRIVALVGFVLDPTLQFGNTQEILKEIATSDTIDGIFDILYKLSGRFVILIKEKERWLFFGDASGMRKLYYYHADNNLYAASDPLFFKEYTELKPSEGYEEFFTSDYYLKHPEYYLPINCTLFKDVYRLVPNHYYDSLRREQIRFYPFQDRVEVDYDWALSEFSRILTNTISEASRRYKLAMPLTAGFDSRLLLSASKKVINDLYFYTLKYRDLKNTSADIRIPSRILHELDLKHNVIDCSMEPDKELIARYNANTYLAHRIDWGKIVCNMVGQYPEDFVALKGTGAELGRKALRRMAITDDMLKQDPFVLMEDDWLEFDVFKDSYLRWFEKTYDYARSFGYDIVDLYYWEHRLGSWQAQSQLEWDFVQEELSPFNNRMLLDLMLKVDIKHRGAPKFEFFVKAIELNWPFLMKFPINPPSFKYRLRLLLKGILKKMGVLDRIKSLR